MEERELIQSLARGQGGASERTWRCPEEAQLAGFVEGRLDEALRRRVQEHVAGCNFCLGQVAALVRLSEAEPPAEVPAELLVRGRELAGSTKSSALFAWRWGAAAAALAGVVIVASVSLRPPQSVEEVRPQPAVSSPATGTGAQPPTAVLPAASEPRSAVRNGSAETAGLQVQSPREGAALPRSALEFRWKPVPQAVFYEVTVVNAEGDRVWEGRAETASLRPPATLALASEEKYFISVRAHLPDGRTLKSPVVGFKLK